MQDITTSEFEGHIIPTPPKGEPLDEYIARRVGEEIDRQLEQRMRVENLRAINHELSVDLRGNPRG